LIEAVRAAAATHPSVHNALAQWREAGEGRAAAEAGYYPQLRVGINSEARSEAINGYDSRRVHQAVLSLTQTVYDFGRTNAEVEQADAQIARAHAQVLMTVDDVAKQAAQAWLQVLHQRRLVELARDQVEGVEHLAGLARERESKGASARSDVVQALARVQSSQAHEQTQQTLAARWRQTLGTLTGRPTADVDGSVPAGLVGVCNSATSEDDVPAAVLAARAGRVVAEQGQKLANLLDRPSLMLEASVARGLDNASRRGGEDVDTGVMLSLTAPLYQGGRNRARQRAALHALQAADAAIARAELEASKAIEEARVQYDGHVQRQRVLAERIDSTRETRDLYQEQYLQLGTRSLVDLLNAEQEYHSARSALVDNEYEMQQLALECLYHQGRLRRFFAIDENLIFTQVNP
jgi:Outer membrane protein